MPCLVQLREVMERWPVPHLQLAGGYCLSPVANEQQAKGSTICSWLALSSLCFYAQLRLSLAKREAPQTHFAGASRAGTLAAKHTLCPC